MTPILHHYAPIGLEEQILSEGLKPTSTHPGSEHAVTYAFLTDATVWPRDAKIDDIWSMNVLKGIVWSIGREERVGPQGLIHVTFEAPDDTQAYDRRRLRASEEAYQATAVPISDRWTWEPYAHAEAVTKTPIPAEKITVVERFDEEQTRALLRRYSQ